MYIYIDISFFSFACNLRMEIGSACNFIANGLLVVLFFVCLCF